MADTSNDTPESGSPTAVLVDLMKFRFRRKPLLIDSELAASLCSNENAAPKLALSIATSIGVSVDDKKASPIKPLLGKETENASKSPTKVQPIQNGQSPSSNPRQSNGLKIEGNNSPDTKKKKPKKRKVKVLSTDTEDEGTKSNDPQDGKRPKSLDVDEEGRTKDENALKLLSESFPGQDIIMLQDALLRADWDVEKAKSTLNESLSNENVKKKPHKSNKKKRRLEIDSCDEDNETDEDDDGRGFKKSKLYDSDADSDEEVSDDLSGEKLKVWEFLSNADLSELQQMPQCSKKKAELIMDCRPFEGWKDLLEKLERKSGVGGSVLNSVQELLQIREVAATLIKKCGKLAAKMEKAVAAGLSNVQSQPKILSEKLKLSDYQLVGLNWLLVMDAHQVNAILADEMGLGKTIQIIAFLAYLKEKKLNWKGKPHLVVVPASTLENWQNEFERWCPTMNVSVYHGSQDDRKYQRIEWSRNGFGDTEVVLTTYSMITSCPEERKMFRIVPLHYAIFDEAHMLKNMYTQRYENLIKIKAPRRVLVTGTPLQNNLLELMSLLVFVMPKMFHGKEEQLKALFNKAPKQQQNNKNNTENSSFERTQISQAKDIMKPFVLRRLKCDVLKDLPEKTAEVISCSMTKDQEKKYKDLITLFSKQAVKELQDEDSEPSENGIVMYSKLRRLANHPLLLRYHFDEDKLREMAKRLQSDLTYKDTVFEYILDDLFVLSDFELHQLCLDFKTCYSFRLPSSLMGQSGKLDEMEKILPKLQDEGHRVLIFSQFVMVLDVLEEHFKNKNYKYLRLDGSTPVNTRQDLIDEYNSDPSILIFMLSTRAGGLGINLTAADTVIIHDVDANPHNDKQAEDRCHRIGQTRPVRVIRLVSKGSIEENILSLAEEKLNLEKEVSKNEEDDQSEKKSVARLLKQALGLDRNTKSKSPAKPSS